MAPEPTLKPDPEGSDLPVVDRPYIHEHRLLPDGMWRAVVVLASPDGEHVGPVIVEVFDPTPKGTTEEEYMAQMKAKLAELVEPVVPVASELEGSFL